jgi:hypothetical protein
MLKRRGIRCNSKLIKIKKKISKKRILKAEQKNTIT